MAICKCKMCGGDLSITELDKVVECEYCGTTQTVPSADNEKKMTLFNRANRLRSNNEFDKAAALFEQLVAEFPEEAEAYWGLCLCNYGIEYVDDPATGKKIPTCHRASFEKLSADENFNLAMEYADVIAQRQYRAEAREIDRINEEILSVSRNETPYDIFICYKETDENGGRTPDSVMAQDIYDALTAKGYKVFFSRISLEDKLGQQYEPYIFAALNSAKIMLSIGTKYEYFHAVWVKNEWSRFLRLAAKDKSKTLIPCYKDMDPYDMPDEFKGLQAQDLGKLGAMQDLVRGVEKLLPKDAPAQPAAPAQVVVANPAAATAESLLKRAFMFLEDGNWQSADEYAEKVLDIDPENAEAYLAKAMAGVKVRTRTGLADCPAFETNANTAKALRFGSEMLKKELNSYIESTHKAEEKRRIVENEQRKAEEERRLAEEELRKEKEKKRKEAEEKKEIETQKMADKVIAAIHEKKYGNASDALQQRLAAMQKEVETLNIVIREFDEVSKRISEQNAVLDALLNQETKLKTQRESLGLFAGKEKKRIDEELAQLAPQSAQAKVAVENLFQRLGGFQTKQQAEQALEIAKKTVKDLTIQIKNAQEQANEAYTLEQAVEIMETNADVLNKVPHGLFWCDVYGKRGTVHFGHYPQKSSTDQSLIEWIVLNRDDNKLFLLSKYGLDCQQYNKEDTPVTWETCTLRKWLNSDFISVAFTKEEQSCIMRTLVRADASPEYKTFPGNNTADKIFLLGYNEFKAFDLEKCHSTAFALKKGVYESDIGCIWWLRSPGYRQNCAAYVLGSGAVSFGSRYTNDSVTRTNISIRPAMWIDLNSLRF